MSLKTIPDPGEYFSKHGLHDVIINRLEYRYEDKTLILGVADINADFADLPDDPGRQPADLCFQGVKRFLFDIDDEADERIWIYDTEIEKKGMEWQLRLALKIGAGELTKGWGVALTFKVFYIDEKPSRQPACTQQPGKYEL